MRAVVQRVTSASVAVAGKTVGSIDAGLCVFVGVGRGDDGTNAERMAEKLWQLRVFEDESGRMNLAAAELGAPLLVISQFTLWADTTRGRRPSFADAAPPEHAEPLVDALVDGLRGRGATVATGRFGADMAVSLVNDGPVTIILEV